MLYYEHTHSQSRNGGKIMDSVLIMVRYPAAGKVKTRLAAAMGEEKAADFYRICAHRILREMGNLPDSIGKYIFYTDSRDRQGMMEWAGPGFMLREQVGVDLGQRLTNAFKEAFADGVGKAVILASDVPDISADIINESLQALDHYDLVLGPCHDGGYYLLGMNAAHPQLFQGIPWSSPEVTERTLARAGKLGLKIFMLPALIDIDDFADFKAWLSQCGETKGALADFLAGFSAV